MEEQYGYFLPLAGKACTVHLDIKPSIGAESLQFIGGGPFFAFLNEDSTIKFFLDALCGSVPEDAMNFISKNYAGMIDLYEIKDMLNAGLEYKYLIKAEPQPKRRNQKTHSVLIINEEKRNSIMHLHLVREPDVFGNWKIYGIERE